MESQPQPVKLHVASDLPVFAGHFPGTPLVPGALQLEWMLAALPGAADPQGSWTVASAKFLIPLAPGTDVEIAITPKNGAFSVKLFSPAGEHSRATFRRDR